MKYDTPESIGNLTDKAFEIIAESLEYGSPSERLQTALQFTQMLTITSFSERLKKLETWSHTIVKKGEQKDEKQ